MKGTVLALFIILNSRDIMCGNKERGEMPGNRPPLTREESVRSITTVHPDSSSDEEEEVANNEEQPGMAPVDLDMQERNAEPPKSFWARLMDMCKCGGRRR